MTFLLFLFSSAIAVSLHLRQTAPRQALRIVGSSFAVILLVLVFGVIRLASPPPAGSQVRVGLIASDLHGNESVVDAGPRSEELFREYGSRIESLAAQGARVIVLPEKLGVAVDPDTKATDAILQSLADKTGATIIAGVVRVAAPLKYNEARVYAPGAAARSYDKHHMLPPFESSLEPGTTRTLLSQPSGTWGVAICKDMDFTGLSRQYGKDGAGLMLVPAWDFFVDRIWHGHEAIMRGVESGFSIVRAAKGGYLTVSDNRGRVLAEAASDSAPFTTLIAEVPAIHDKTLYLVLGDWFAWLSIAILLITIAQLFRPRRPGDSTL
jgi:apolipoprotein N-acyltransferase